MSELNNPAGRLHYWLARTRPTATSHPAFGALSLWCDAWGLEQDNPADQAERMKRGVALMDAVVQTRSLAEASTNPMAALGLSTLNQVESCVQFFAVLPRTTSQEFFQHLGDDGLRGLNMLGTMLMSESSEGSVSDEDQVSLLDQTRRLIDAVVAADDLSIKDKNLIVKRLRDVEDALIRVTVTGAGDVQRATDGLMGVMVRLWVSSADVRSHPATKAVFALISALLVTLGAGADYAAIADSGFGQLLELPGGAEPPQGP